MTTHMIADAIAVLHDMDGGDSHQTKLWEGRAQKEMAANPRVNVGCAVQHLLRAAWYRGYKAGLDETDED